MSYSTLLSLLLPIVNLSIDVFNVPVLLSDCVVCHYYLKCVFNFFSIHVTLRVEICSNVRGGTVEIALILMCMNYYG